MSSEEGVSKPLKRWALPPLPISWPDAFNPTFTAASALQEMERWKDYLQQKLNRIAEAHSKHVGEGGLTSGQCNECSWNWPCPTNVWATTMTRNPYMDTWDPQDDS